MEILKECMLHIFFEHLLLILKGKKNAKMQMMSDLIHI